jgi:hemoglobin
MRMRTMVIAAIAALAVACGGGNKGGGGGDTMKKPDGAEQSLYDRLGGKDNIAKVIDKFVVIVVADARINKFFEKADPANLKKQLVEQICEKTGGPCKYTGKDMKTAHTGLGIKGEHFDALVEDLGKAMTEVGVPPKEQGEIAAALGPLKAEIVSE